MPKTQLVIQLGRRAVYFGRSGDSKPLAGRILVQEDVYNKQFLTKLLKEWCQNHLVANVSKAEILVVENVLLPVNHKQVVSSVLSDSLRAHSVRFLPDVLASCVAAGVRNAIVIDIGWEHLLIVPVFDLRIMDKQMGVSTKSGRYLKDKVEQGPLDDENESFELVLERLWIDEGLKNLRDVIASELIGRKGEGVFDLNEFPIVPLLWKIYRQLPIDIRGILKDRLIVTGLVSQSPGFLTQLEEEVSPTFSIIDTLGPWAGGSLYSKQLYDLRRTHPQTRQLNDVNQASVQDWHLQKFTLNGTYK